MPSTLVSHSVTHEKTLPTGVSVRTSDNQYTVYTLEGDSMDLDNRPAPTVWSSDVGRPTSRRAVVRRSVVANQKPTGFGRTWYNRSSFLEQVPCFLLGKQTAYLVATRNRFHDVLIFEGSL